MKTRIFTAECAKDLNQKIEDYEDDGWVAIPETYHHLKGAYPDGHGFTAFSIVMQKSCEPTNISH